MRRLYRIIVQMRNFRKKILLEIDENIRYISFLLLFLALLGDYGLNFVRIKIIFCCGKYSYQVQHEFQGDERLN